MKEFLNLLFKGIYQLSFFWLAMAGVVIINLLFLELLDELKMLKKLYAKDEAYLVLIMCVFSIAAVFKVFIIGSKEKESFRSQIKTTDSAQGFAPGTKRID